MFFTKNLIKQFIPPILLRGAGAARSFVRSIKNKQPISESLASKIIKIGNTQILIPTDHKLDGYLNAYPRYDQALGEIARIMHEHMGPFTAIDIGANVGDSAALICKHQRIPVLCIEGCREFMPYLKLNVANMGTHIKVVDCFVGSQTGFIDDKLMNIKNGTASITGVFGEKTQKESLLNNIKTLEEIILQNKNFGNAKLIKIDTDGCDFSIISHSLNYLKKKMPTLFFEYDPSYKNNDANNAKTTINALWEIGYQHFLIYDNFGNFLITLHDTNSFCDLNAYLASNRRTKQIIYYFDVCAISNENVDLFEKIRNYELHNSHQP